MIIKVSHLGVRFFIFLGSSSVRPEPSLKTFVLRWFKSNLPTLSNRINILQKEVKTIVKITKQECIELQKLGYKFGSEGTLHHTWTKHHKYYLTESRKAMADLDKIRKSHIAKR